MPKVRPLTDRSSSAEKTSWQDSHAREHEFIRSISASFIGGLTTNTFTGTLTGMTASTTGTVNYVVNNNVALVYITADITGTSNSTSMTMTGLPTSIQPTNTVAPMCGNMENNGTTGVLGQASVSSGVITFLMSSGSIGGVTLLATGFTNSGIKGINSGWIISYPLK